MNVLMLIALNYMDQMSVLTYISKLNIMVATKPKEKN